MTSLRFSTHYTLSFQFFSNFWGCVDGRLIDIFTICFDSNVFDDEPGWKQSDKPLSRVNSSHHVQSERGRVDTETKLIREEKPGVKGISSRISKPDKFRRERERTTRRLEPFLPPVEENAFSDSPIRDCLTC